MDTKILIGRRVQLLRKSARYSQERLAEIIGINAKYLSAIERGQENPTLDLLIRLAHGLKVEIHELFRVEHTGESPKVLRKKLTATISEFPEGELVRILRLIEAVRH